MNIRCWNGLQISHDVSCTSIWVPSEPWSKGHSRPTDLALHGHGATDGARPLRPRSSNRGATLLDGVREMDVKSGSSTPGLDVPWLLYGLFSTPSSCCLLDTQEPFSFEVSRTAQSNFGNGCHHGDGLVILD